MCTLALINEKKLVSWYVKLIIRIGTLNSFIDENDC